MGKAMGLCHAKMWVVLEAYRQLVHGITRQGCLKLVQTVNMVLDFLDCPISIREAAAVTLQCIDRLTKKW